MRRALLAMVAVSVLAGLAPAGASHFPVDVTRTIVAPAETGWTDGVVNVFSIMENPTDPEAWEKMSVNTTAPRCGYIKQDDEHVIPAGTAQDGTTGKFGYVIKLQSGFDAGDSFHLTADAANAQFDFDVVFFKTLGKCVYNRKVEQPLTAANTCVSATVPLEGAEPTPPVRREDEGVGPGDVCGPDLGGKKSVWLSLGSDSGTLGFDADYAIIVMPIGANGKFTFSYTTAN